MFDLGREYIKLSNKETADIIIKAQNGCTESYDFMVKNNIRAVSKIVLELTDSKPGFNDYNDYLVEGVTGVMVAIERFNPSEENTFLTYARHWICQKIRRYQQSKAKVVRIPVAYYALVGKYKNFKRYYRDKYGSLPSDEEVMDHLKITYTRLQRLYKIENVSYCSLNSNNLNGKNEFVELLECESSEKETANTFLSEDLSIGFEALNEREKKIIEYRFGLVTNKPLTLEETSKHFNITRERVRQIEEGALKKMKKAI